MHLTENVALLAIHTDKVNLLANVDEKFLLVWTQQQIFLCHILFGK